MKIVFTFISSFLVLFVSAQDVNRRQTLEHAIFRYGGLERADTTQKIIYLTFTGGDYNDGGKWINRILKKKSILAHFFFTGDFYRNQENKKLIKNLRNQGHYLGPHSDKHLLYASWNNRDSLFVNKNEFTTDLNNNYKVMSKFGLSKKDAPLFMPPFEWYNQQICNWTAELGLVLINYTPGTRSNADYTTPEMGKQYIASEEIYKNILNYESSSSNGLNGFILLIHIGTAPERIDKFYFYLEDLITELSYRGYQFEKLTDFFN